MKCFNIPKICQDVQRKVIQSEWTIARTVFQKCLICLNKKKVSGEDERGWQVKDDYVKRQGTQLTWQYYTEIKDQEEEVGNRFTTLCVELHR